ncbi:uncharacterized protein LOC124117748 [Haliotis rufescens]|uniref:uncharacterized protein LOC124117748 n=1 Tax=Haliotis rufescens TaxID=6454 RepID=UPI00201ED324|nr:uncharacterized protein LOC124117748 [Haliotis rufescens]
MAGYWTVWAIALYIGMATGQGITVTQCNTTYQLDLSVSYFQDKKIEKGIRRRGNATSLVECLLVCDRFSAGNLLYNRATQDCICPLGYPLGMVSAPGYTYYSTPGLTGTWMTEAINASSQGNGYPLSSVIGGSTSVWKPRSDDAAPWIEVGIDTFLYFAMVQIYPDISTFTKDIWFRDSNRNWMVTWTRNYDDEAFIVGIFIPHCQMLTVPTDAIRITLDKHSSVEVARVYVRGLL